uniref:Uncharacterized protein n=1 Tax=Rhizophora mucronata TaxID=61149 RepID=A0A2P2IJX4_RHIMU
MGACASPATSLSPTLAPARPSTLNPSDSGTRDRIPLPVSPLSSPSPSPT